MPWYFFNRCSREALPQIESLAQELGLKECETPTDGYRTWTGDIFDRPDESERRFIVRYSGLTKEPFMLETKGETTHAQPDVKAVIKRFIDICKPTDIKRAITSYDMAEFD